MLRHLSSTRVPAKAFPSPNGSHFSGAIGRRPTVLAVDDEDAILEWLAASLDVSGYDAVLAADAGDAITILESSRVDAVILDVRLIGASGLDVLKFVRSSVALASLPVIILTGVSRLSDAEEETIRRNRADVFYKSDGIDEIITTLDRCLEKRGPD